MKVDSSIKMELNTAIAAALATPEGIDFIRASAVTIVTEAVKINIRDSILEDVQKAIKDILDSVVAEVVGGGIPPASLDTIGNVIEAESSREEVESR